MLTQREKPRKISKEELAKIINAEYNANSD
jgi:hypothetical protein